LVVVVGKSLVVHGACGFGLERQSELFLPIEFVARIAQGVVTVLSAGTAAGHIGSMRSNFVGNDPVLYVLFVRQSELFFWCDVTKHRRAVPANHCRANRRSDVIVSKNYVGYQGTKSIERRFVAKFAFLINLLLDLVHWYVTRALD